MQVMILEVVSYGDFGHRRIRKREERREKRNEIESERE